jgi:ribosomal protein S14
MVLLLFLNFLVIKNYISLIIQILRLLQKNKVKNQKYKDQKRRNSYLKKELNSFIIKGSSFLDNTNTKTKSLSPDRTVNRCFLTNRSRGVLRKFKMSRGSLRDLLLFSKIGGFNKSSW